MPIQLVPSDCSMWPPVGSGALRSKTPMLSRPEKATLENVSAVGVLAVDPPGEIEHQLLKNPLKKLAVAFAAPFHLDFVDTPGGPGVDRRIDIAKGPLVGRQLAVGMHVPLAGHEQ